MPTTKTLTVAPEPGALTPARVSDLIEIALREGKGPEAVATIKELVAVAKDVQAIQAKHAFNAAFAEFKIKCPKVLKTKPWGDTTDAGGKARGMYAPIEEIARSVDPVLLPLGLSYGWSSEDTGDSVRVTCTLRHVAGHSESAIATIRKGAPNRAQTVAMVDGGAMTTAQRRALSMVLGLVTEDKPADAPPSEPVISEQKAADLAALAAEVESRTPGTRDRLLNWAGVDALENLPARLYDEAVKGLEKRRKS